MPEGEVLESGWEELGMDDQWAARVATDMADEDNPTLPIDFYKVWYRFSRVTAQTAVLYLWAGCVVDADVGLWQDECIWELN